jgi:hypothetical protein
VKNGSRLVGHGSNPVTYYASDHIFGDSPLLEKDWKYIYNKQGTGKGKRKRYYILDEHDRNLNHHVGSIKRPRLGSKWIYDPPA